MMLALRRTPLSVGRRGGARVLSTASLDTSLKCSATGASYDGGVSPLFKCPAATVDQDPVLMPAALSESDLKRLVATASSTTASDSASSSPFITWSPVAQMH